MVFSWWYAPPPMSGERPELGALLAWMRELPNFMISATLPAPMYSDSFPLSFSSDAEVALPSLVGYLSVSFESLLGVSGSDSVIAVKDTFSLSFSSFFFFSSYSSLISKVCSSSASSSNALTSNFTLNKSLCIFLSKHSSRFKDSFSVNFFRMFAILIFK